MHNGPDMGLAKADDPIWDTSAVSVIENGLLAHQFTDHQQLLVDMPTGGQKATAAIHQSVNAREITLQVPQLLLDGLADLVNPGLLLLGYDEKLLPRLFAVRTRLVAKALPDLRMHRINQDLSHLPGFIEQG